MNNRLRALWPLLLWCALACSGLTDPTGAPSTPAASAEAPRVMAVGACLSAGVTVPCESPHDEEVSAIYALSEPRQSDEDLDRTAQHACSGALVTYTGLEPVDTPLTYGWSVPSAEEWAAGDRGLRCVVLAPEPRTASARAG